MTDRSIITKEFPNDVQRLFADIVSEDIDEKGDSEEKL
jgi:hypothetical protein